MAQARLNVGLPAGPWVGEVSRAVPEARIQVPSATPGDGAGFALVKITADDVDGTLDAIEVHETIDAVSVVALSDEVAPGRRSASADLAVDRRRVLPDT